MNADKVESAQCFSAVEHGLCVRPEKDQRITPTVVKGS